MEQKCIVNKVKKIRAVRICTWCVCTCTYLNSHNYSSFELDSCPYLNKYECMLKPYYITTGNKS